tara:strand:- start:100 stop:459 length:360 start_codon:yes stop_codon:yes gene_type:complete
MNCTENTNQELNEILLRVDGQWVPYKGSTSLRKLYYRASSMVREGSKSFYVYDYEDSKVDAAIFPDRFWRDLSCFSMNGVDVHLLPTRLFAPIKKCTLVQLGNNTGFICTHCGVRKSGE